MERFHEYNRELAILMAQLVESKEESHQSDLSEECQDLLHQMKIEARSMEDPDCRGELLERLRIHEQNLRDIKRKKERDALLFEGNYSQHADAQRKALEKTEDLLDRQNETLEFARRTIQETEEVGMEIQKELERNRETIQTTHGKVIELREDTRQANSILTNMSKWWNR